MATRKRQTAEERFNKFFVKTESCWIWTGDTYGSKNSAGRFKVKSKPVPAHKWAYENKFKIVVPKPFMVRHKCGKGLCVNPDHLYVARDCVIPTQPWIQFRK